MAATNWQPTCSTEILRMRAKMLAEVRSFFVEHGYLEVETPLLSSDIVVDAHLDPFEVDGAPVDGRRFLQTSPEAAMKRLLAAGSGSIFQITKSFRKGEVGRLHNPEFTMIEWYGVGTTWADQTELTADLVRRLGNCVSDSADAWWNKTFQTITYDDAFLRDVGHRVLDKSDSELLDIASTLNLSSDVATLSRDDLLNQILAEIIEPQLGCNQPEFLCNYPISQAALAVQNPDDARTACRFELYVSGLELCNGYEELTNAAELKNRDKKQNGQRNDRSADELPGAERLVAAMESGLPECSGVALGFDRLLMAITGETEIARVIPFPFSIA